MEITEESLMVLSRRRRGRPTVEAKKVPVTTWVPPAYYDRLTKMAHARGEHLSAFLCVHVEKIVKGMK